MPTRREFLTNAGATITLLMIPMACASSSAPSQSTDAGKTAETGGAPDTGGTPETGGAPEASAAETGNGCGGAFTTSTNVSSHTHTLCVPTADLGSPSAGGATYTSSTNPDPLANNDQHSHMVTLTAAQLTAIDGGGTVTVTSTIADSHNHDFAIRKA